MRVLVCYSCFVQVKYKVQCKYKCKKYSVSVNVSIKYSWLKCSNVSKLCQK